MGPNPKPRIPNPEPRALVPAPRPLAPVLRVYTRILMQPKHIALLATILAFTLTDASSTRPLEAQSVLTQGGQVELGLERGRDN